MFKKYVKLLKENSIKITPQRLEILKYLDENRTHPTVDEIYSELKEKNPSLSKTTVYNSLEILSKHGIIQTLAISSSELRYDFENKMHHHFLCKNCGKIIDMEILCDKCNGILGTKNKCPSVEELLKGGHKVDEIHGYFKGICKKCLEKGTNENGS